MATIKLSHTRITFFINKVPLSIRRYIVGFVSLLTAFITFLIAYYGIDIVKVSLLSRSTGLGYPLIILYISAPLSCLIMSVIFFVQGVLQLQGKYPLEADLNQEGE